MSSNSWSRHSDLSLPRTASPASAGPGLALGKVNPKKIILRKPTQGLHDQASAVKILQAKLPKPVIKVRAKKIVVGSKPYQSQRPSTPEHNLDQCFECDAMRDFIAGLQGEVKRL